jgi:arabinose-5-phosphate isomerase
MVFTITLFPIKHISAFVRYFFLYLPQRFNPQALKNTDEIRHIAIRTINDECAAIEGLKKSINNDFVKCIELILQSKGRVVVTGIGKSANIAAKIVSTLNSTGTQSVFMHAADAVHGDLGMIRQDDIIICISKSGSTPEIKVLVPLLKLMGNKLVALVGNINSYLALQADIILDTSVEREACPNNLAPTSSTTAQLVMGDALAVALLECRGFTASDFARYHPGGALGKRLYLRVADLYINNEKPQVASDTAIREIILEISSRRLGCTAVVENGKLLGIITDGDLRRMLQGSMEVSKLKATDILSRDPLTVSSDALVSDALDLMRSRNITQLLVVDNGIYVGVIHLHDILKEGII